jgi:hypothetical protein
MVLRDRRAEPVRSVLEVPGRSSVEIVDVLSSQTPRWRQMLELPHNATDAVAVEAIEEARRKGGRDVLSFGRSTSSRALLCRSCIWEVTMGTWTYGSRKVGR